MNSLFSLIPAGERTVDLAVLEAAAFDGDVLIDCLTDEELFWLRNGEASPDPAMDEPYLSSLDDRARQVATDSGLRSLIAKGMVDLDPDDPSSLDFAGAYAVLADLRRAPTVITRLRLDVPGDESVRYAFGRVSDGLVLTEEVADGGFHDFVLQSPVAAASALATVFDRSGTANLARDTPRPSGNDGAGMGLHTVLVRSVGRLRDSVEIQRSLTVEGEFDGVYVSEHRNGPTDPDRRRLSRDRLEELAFDLILGDTTSG